MDEDDIVDETIKEVLIGLLCDSCRSKKYIENFLDVVFLQARKCREETKECQRRMDEAYERFNTLITKLENEDAGL